MSRPESTLIKTNLGIARVGKQIAITNKLLQTIEPFLIPYRKGSKWGFCDWNKNIVIDCVYEELTRFSGGIAAIKIGGKWGVINAYGKIVAKCNYDNVHVVSGLAGLKRNNQWILIDKNGIQITQNVFDNLVSNSFSDEIIIIEQNGHFGAIGKNGGKLIECIYKSPGFRFIDGYARVILTQGLGCNIINTKGECIFKKNYDWVEFNRLENPILISDFKKKHVFFIDRYERQIGKYFNRALLFSENICAVELDNKVGFIDCEGNMIIENRFKKWMYRNWSDGHTYCFYDGLAIVYKENAKMGFINKTGHDEMAKNYDYVHKFSDDLALVRQNNVGWGFINKRGEEIISLIYEMAIPFREGRAAIKKEGYWGFINQSGEEVVPCIYSREIHQDVSTFSFGFYQDVILVNFRGKPGYINKDGVHYWED